MGVGFIRGMKGTLAFAHLPRAAAWQPRSLRLRTVGRKTTQTRETRGCSGMIALRCLASRHLWSADTGRVATVLPVRIQEDRLDDKGSDLRSFKLDKDTPAGQLLPQSALNSQEAREGLCRADSGKFIWRRRDPGSECVQSGRLEKVEFLSRGLGSRSRSRP